MIDCKHWNEGKCSLGLYGGKPSAGVCGVCKSKVSVEVAAPVVVADKTPSGKSKGLGDTIEKITKATGIKKVVDAVAKATGRPCNCAERKAKLNAAFPYKE